MFLEYIFIFLMVFAGIGLLVFSFRKGKDGSCSGCSGDCSSCGIKRDRIVEKKNDEEE